MARSARQSMSAAWLTGLFMFGVAASWIGAHPPEVEGAAKVLLRIDLSRGWQDGSWKASAKPTWKALPAQDGEAGVAFQFPALQPDEWFNLHSPIREGSWPRRGQKIVFRARAEPAGKALIRLNQMPGAAPGKQDRHDEFQGHAAAFAAGPEWREVQVGLSEFRVLWRHAGSTGRLDLANVTSIGFEPADPLKPLHLEIAACRVVDGEPPATAPWPDYRIAFNSDRDGNYEIYAMDMDGRNLDRLTNHPGFDLWPAPSPDGKRLAWMSNRDGSYQIYVMNADGSNPVNLTRTAKSTEGHPTWSPDGKTLAFSSDRDGAMELYLMDADGSNPRRLTRERGTDGLPTFSPDSKQIVFDSRRDGHHQLYRVNADGTGLTRLTRRPGLDTMPAWSPDGKTIAFVSDRDGDQAIFLMNPDGSNVRRLSGLRAFEGWPDWSPDGRFLCYHADLHGHFTICVVEVASGRVEQLTRGRGSNRNPRFMRLAEDSYAAPAVPPGGVRLVGTVSGYLTSGPGGPNPQKYPFSYRGYGILDREQWAALARPGEVPAAIARNLGQALLWPGVGDELKSITLKVEGSKLTGEAQVLHKYGKQGTHTIVAKLEGAFEKGKLALRAVKPEISGTWDWGGGIARQQGEVTIALEVQGSAADHGPAVKENPAPATDQPKDAPKETPKAPVESPAKMGDGLKITAKIEGYTQATMFNPQKYPFKYTGTGQLDAEQLKALAKEGDVPEAAAKALAACLLWPKMDDKLEKAAFKNDGKKLIGDVEVLHRYGKQGTHTLKLRLEGTIENNRLKMKITESKVTGTWDYGGGTIQLQGKVDITIETP
jgi:hypothetical protein